MKKWISYLMAAFLILAALLPRKASAEALPNAAFSVNSNDVAVTLQLPEGKTETITSLQFQLTVSIVTGTMEAPVFSFSNALESTVKDADISKDTDGSYLVDIVLSGKQNQDIFKDSAQAEIGTLSLKPSGSTLKAVVTFGMKKNGTQESVISYVTANGSSVQTVSLSGTKEATVNYGNSAASPSPSGSSNTAGSASPVLPAESEDTAASTAPAVTSDSITPAAPVTPAEPATPVTPAVPVDSESEDTENTGTSATAESGFPKKKSPALKISVKNGSSRITLRWNAIRQADGYLVYRYHKNSKSYKKIKTISDPSVTSYSKKMKYGSQYSFKIRAFSLNESGEKTYGKFSSAIKAVTAPEKVKKLSRSNKILSWSKVSNADGYQILYSSKKNGTYSPVKTITKKTSVKLSSLLRSLQKKEKAYYWKVRAYTNTTDGKRIYSVLSKACKG